MSGPLDALRQPGPTGQTPPPGRLQKKLRVACDEMEAAFLRQLFQAMRETASQENGLFETSQGEEIFTELMDDTLASKAAERMTRGLGDALYRQLAPHLLGEG